MVLVIGRAATNGYTSPTVFAVAAVVAAVVAVVRIRRRVFDATFYIAVFGVIVCAVSLIGS